MRQQKEKGSLTVETVIFLTLFMVFSLILMQFIDMVRAQIMIQSAITETSKELATYSYILEKAGYFSAMGELQEDAANSSLNDLRDSYASFTSAIESGETPDKNEFLEFFDTIKNLKVNDFTAPVLAKVGATASDRFMAFASQKLTKKYLTNGKGSTDYLESLGVKGGYEGLDFSCSSFAKGKDEPIRVTVVYEIEILNIPFLEDLSINKKIALNSSTRIWGN